VILREFDKATRAKDAPLVEDRFMTLEGTPEWNLLMNTLLFDDHELEVHNEDLKHNAPTEITEFNLDELTNALDEIEKENS
jgi:hypothetical protein